MDYKEGWCDEHGEVEAKREAHSIGCAAHIGFLFMVNSAGFFSGKLAIFVAVLWMITTFTNVNKYRCPICNREVDND